MPPMFKLTYKLKNDRSNTCRSSQERRGPDAIGKSGVEGSADAGEWASVKFSTSLDDKIVTKIRTKLEADGKL